MRSFCSSDPGQNLSDLDLESNPNQYQMACWAGIVTHFGETILFLIFHTSECTKFGVPNVCQTVPNCLSHILQWYSISKQPEPNPNNTLCEHSIDFDRTILFSKIPRLRMDEIRCDQCVTNVWQKVCHTFVTHLSQPDSPSRKVPIESRGKTYRWVGPLGHPDTANLLQKLCLAFWARFDRFWGSLG